jgi:hypothetical protein
MRTALLASLLAAVAVAGCGSVSATGHAGHATAAPSVTPAQVATEAPVPLSPPPPGPSSPPPPATATAAPPSAPATTPRPAPPAAKPPAPKPPPPPPVSKKPAPKPPPPPPPPPKAACHPLTNGGNCYEPGEFCRAADHGVTGLAGDGEVITCQDNDGWRWEPQ